MTTTPKTNKYKNTIVLADTGQFKSKLEWYAANELTKEKLTFEYEPFSITLLDKTPMISWEKYGKSFKKIEYARPITYTPDFIGNWWVMETKGKRTADFDLKWKMFKHYLYVNKMDDFVLFMPTNQKEIRHCIEIIKDINQEKERLFFKKYKMSMNHSLTKEDWDKIFELNNKKKNGKAINK